MDLFKILGCVAMVTLILVIAVKLAKQNSSSASQSSASQSSSSASGSSQSSTSQSSSVSH